MQCGLGWYRFTFLFLHKKYYYFCQCEKRHSRGASHKFWKETGTARACFWLQSETAGTLSQLFELHLIYAP